MPGLLQEADFELLFDSAPISLWLEDYSALKTLFEHWRAQGVTDIEAHLRNSPELFQQCAQCLQVIKVNQQTLKVFAAPSQKVLIERLSDVFRGDMFEQMLLEMKYLWHGTLNFTNQTVNYGLDGRRIDVQICVRVLQGHEAKWDRVLVSLEDVTEREQARRQLTLSERYARDLFDYSPVSLWVEDFSGVKHLLDEARGLGIRDFRVFVNVHPDFVSRCAAKINVLDVNQETLSMFAAQSKEELLGKLDCVFRDEMHDSFAEQLQDLWNGKTTQMREVINYSLSGEVINIHMQFAVLAGHEATWDMVLVSLVDITARKKAEAYLEYLGKHDSLTRLCNRAFYTDELNRLSRKGPWPLSVLLMDLNGLKQINDVEGHGAGDSLLRRAGEVLTSANVGKAYCVARIGGDEFVALMPGCDARLAHSFRERIESLIELNNQYYPGQKLSMAIGVATGDATTSAESIVGLADKSMYESKARYYEEEKMERRRG